MAISYFYSALAALGSFVLYTQVQNWLQWRALKQWGKQQGCGDMVSVPNYLPGGCERFFMFFLYGTKRDILEDVIRARYKQMNRYTYRIFNPFNNTILSTADPANIQAILSTKSSDWEFGPVRGDNFRDAMGHGIFTAEGEEWTRFRGQLKPQFSRDLISDLESADRHVEILFKALPEENSSGWIESVDIMPFFYRLTMDVSTEFLFGRSVNSQTNALHSIDAGSLITEDHQAEMDFTTSMDFSQKYLAWRMRLMRLWWLFNSREFQKARTTVQSFGEKCVREALDRTEPYKKNAPTPPQAELADGENPKKKYVFLEELIKETRDPAELRDQSLHLLLAGRDTTSALLSWTILLLARHPAEFHSLRKTVIDTFGTYSSSPSSSSNITFSSLKACKPLTYSLQEALRLYPLLPLNARTAKRDTVLPVGGGKDGKEPLAVMKGELVTYVTYVMHRRSDIWGEDCDVFRPGRWEGRKMGWDYIPFSGGPRVCLGQQYALNEAGFVLVRILQRFDQIEALDMTSKLETKLAITMAPSNGVNIRMHRAAE